MINLYLIIHCIKKLNEKIIKIYTFYFTYDWSDCSNFINLDSFVLKVISFYFLSIDPKDALVSFYRLFLDNMVSYRCSAYLNNLIWSSLLGKSTLENKYQNIMWEIRISNVFILSKSKWSGFQNTFIQIILSKDTRFNIEIFIISILILTIIVTLISNTSFDHDKTTIELFYGRHHVIM